MTLITTILGFLQPLWTIISWPLRRMGRAMGITSAPDIRLGSLMLVALENDPRPGYDSWWHLECINKQRGKLSSMIRTQDAVGCRVRLIFTPLLASGPAVEDDGVFLQGTSQPPVEVATLVVDRPMPIPLYIQVPQGGPHPLNGQALQGGAYLTGAQFLCQPALVERQRVTAGTYGVTVKLTWNRQHFTRHFEIPAQTSSWVPPEDSSRRRSRRKPAEVMSDGIRWRETGETYGGEFLMEALCPIASFAIQIMVKLEA